MIKNKKQQYSHSPTEDGEKYRMLFEASEDPMWLIIDQKFEICNDAAVRTLGYKSQSELRNTHPSQLSPKYQEDGKPSFDAAEEMMTIALTKGYHRFHWTHTKKSGENFPVEVTLTKIPFQGKDAIFCVWRDITDQYNLEKELREAKINAEEASKSKSKFLSMMSHELRTPLNAVLGFSDMLKNELYGPLNEKQMGTVKSIYQGGELLLHLVDDLLSMAKIDQGEINLNIEHNNASEIVKNSINLVEKLANDSQITLHCEDIPDDLNCLYADRVRAEQILVNLLTNAIKYNQPGGNIWISVDKNNSYTRFSVEDDGKGIQRDHAKQIFEPFYRGEQTTSGIEGTGLGLPICRRLSIEMNGECDFESVYGQGSVFWLDLPRCVGCPSFDDKCDIGRKHSH